MEGIWTSDRRWREALSPFKIRRVVKAGRCELLTRVGTAISPAGGLGSPASVWASAPRPGCVSGGSRVTQEQSSAGLPGAPGLRGSVVAGNPGVSAEWSAQSPELLPQPGNLRLKTGFLLRGVCGRRLPFGYL